MAEVSITIKGRQYDIACDDGQEKRVVQLASYIDDKIKMIARSGSAYNESHLMVLTSLVLADEIFDAREATRACEEGETTVLDQDVSGVEDKEAIKIIKKMAKRIDALTAKLRDAQ